MTRCLTESFIPFGVMEFYADRSLPSTLSALLQLLMTISLSDLFVFPDFLDQFFVFLQVLFKYQMNFVIQLESPKFLLLCHSLLEGLILHSYSFLSTCADAFSELFQFYLQEEKLMLQQEKGLAAFPSDGSSSSPSGTAAGPQGYFLYMLPSSSFSSADRPIRSSSSASPAKNILLFKKHFEQLPHFLLDVFSLVLNLYLFETSLGQSWVLSKPLYAALCMDKEMLNEYQAKLLQIQQPEYRQKLSASFSTLVNGVSFSYSPADQSKFISHLTTFRAEIVYHVIKPVY